MVILIPDISPYMSNLFISEGLYCTWASRDQNLVLMVRIISSAYRDLGFMFTESCKPVSFSWKVRNPESNNTVDTKMESSIGVDPVLLTQQSILAIFLPYFSTSFPGSFESLIFCKTWKIPQMVEELTCCCFWIMAQNNLVPDAL